MTRPQNQNPTMVLKRYRPRHSPARAANVGRSRRGSGSPRNLTLVTWRESPMVSPYLVDKCHGERDGMLGQVRTFLFHERVKPALAEMAIPFLKVLSFDE